MASPTPIRAPPMSWASAAPSDALASCRSGRHRAARLGRPRRTASTRGSNTPSRTAGSMPSAPRSSAARASSSRRAKPYTFTSTGDRYGWTEGDDGRGHLTLFVQNGRVQDVPAPRSRLPRCAGSRSMHDGDFRITPNQNLIIANVPTGEAADDRAHRARGRPARAAVGLAAQFDGLRRAADLRPRARRERALSAGAARRAR